jgi:hypothetical protein
MTQSAAKSIPANETSKNAMVDVTVPPGLGGIIRWMRGRGECHKVVQRPY